MESTPGLIPSEGPWRAPSADAWRGRTDGAGPQHRRWHQAARETDGTEHHDVGAARPPVGAGHPDQTGSARGQDGYLRGVALIGFASDDGVRRNHGRPGAAQGPDALRRALGPMAMHADFPVTDGGTVVVEDGDLESAQSRLADHLADLLDGHRLVVVLGGGHETAWGSYLGRTRSTRLAGLSTGVLNLDAHFDLREADEPTSGTPFLQMARAEGAAGRAFRYTVLGISAPSNTRALFRTAAELGVEHLTDEDCSAALLPRVLEAVDRLLARIDVLHLSIDLDVLPAAVAPGVSAPAGFGVALEVVHAVCRHVARSGKLALVDIVELLPALDVDDRTARTAARLVHTIAHDALGGPATGPV